MHLDRWDADGVEFVFGFDAHENLVLQAEILPESAWKRLVHEPRYEVQTEPRRKRRNVQQRIVGERMFEELRLESEDVAEFAYRPTACRQTYRMVVVRKNLSVRVAQRRLFDDVRYFFYLTNLEEEEAAEVVSEAHARCHQENLIQQLHAGCRALRAALDTLESNGAYTADDRVGLEPEGLGGALAAGVSARAGKSGIASRSGRCWRWSSGPSSTPSCGCRARSCGAGGG